jgi:hypothetical protein
MTSDVCGASRGIRRDFSNEREDCSVRLQESGRGGGIRTPDPLVPNQMRYQAALRPDCPVIIPQPGSAPAVLHPAPTFHPPPRTSRALGLFSRSL